MSTETVLRYLHERGPATHSMIGAYAGGASCGEVEGSGPPARLSPSTIRVHLVAVRYAHLLAGYHDPTANPEVKGLMRSLRSAYRESGEEARRITAPLPISLLAKASTPGLDENPEVDARDRALLLIGFFGALRVTELAHLTFEQVSMMGDGGLQITPAIHGSRAEPSPNSCRHLPFRPASQLCPASAFGIWATVVGKPQGYVFRPRGGRYRHAFINRAMTTNSCNAILRQRLSAAGVQDSERYSCQSLRAGFFAAASELGWRNSSLVSP